MTTSQLRVRGPALLFATLFCAACDTDGDGVEAPINITSTAPPSASVNELFSYQVMVDDAAGAVTYTVSSGPTGLTISSTGLVEWTPTIADLGTVSATVTVADPQAEASQAFDVAVDQGVLLGVGISPKGHTTTSTNDDFVAQYTTPDETGRVIGFFDPWRLDETADGELTALTESAFIDAENFDFIPLVALKWADGVGEPDLTSESEPANDTWTNVETRAEFLMVVSEIAANWQPRYLGLGHETNLYFATHTQAEWDAWITEFEACYDGVKALSPDTIVFTIFQWEVMNNLGVGTIGWDFPPHLQLIDDHVASGKIDAIAFTSFPYWEHATPDVMPEAYFSGIAAHWDGPVLFTEIAWPASAHPPFPGSEEDQRDFIGRFFDLTAAFDLEYVGWTYQHDWDGEGGAPAFASIGFRSNDGTVIRASDSAWASEIVLRESAD